MPSYSATFAWNTSGQYIWKSSRTNQLAFYNAVCNSSWLQLQWPSCTCQACGHSVIDLVPPAINDSYFYPPFCHTHHSHILSIGHCNTVMRVDVHHLHYISFARIRQTQSASTMMAGTGDLAGVMSPFTITATYPNQ